MSRFKGGWMELIVIVCVVFMVAVVALVITSPAPASVDPNIERCERLGGIAIVSHWGRHNESRTLTNCIFKP